MTLTERQKTILDALIREYVVTAEPVSSGELVRKYSFSYSPATIRNELCSLDQGGLIFQPHTSSGRIPTDKGYRFFIEHIERDAGGGNEREQKLERLFGALRGIDDEFEFLRQASRLLSQLSQEFTMAGFFAKGLLYKSGLAEVLRETEFESEASAREFGELVDSLDDEIRKRFCADDFPEPQVFIGGENPIREARNYTMMFSSSRTQFGEEGLFAILGPRRMNYEKNLALLRAMQRFFD